MQELWNWIASHIPLLTLVALVVIGIVLATHLFRALSPNYVIDRGHITGVPTEVPGGGTRQWGWGIADIVCLVLLLIAALYVFFHWNEIREGAMFKHTITPREAMERMVVSVRRSEVGSPDPIEVGTKPMFFVRMSWNRFDPAMREKFKIEIDKAIAKHYPGGIVDTYHSVITIGDINKGILTSAGAHVTYTAPSGSRTVSIPFTLGELFQDATFVTEWANSISTTCDNNFLLIHANGSGGENGVTLPAAPVAPTPSPIVPTPPRPSP